MHGKRDIKTRDKNLCNHYKYSYSESLFNRLNHVK
jgi:hypothetical protein